MREKSEFWSGHELIGKRINVKRELGRLATDPLHEALEQWDAGRSTLFRDELERYRDAYGFYYLSMARFLPLMSLAARELRARDRLGRNTSAMSHQERRVVTRYRSESQYLEFDLVNVILHSRILLDRLIALSRHFLRKSPLPSFTSFSDHKKFFVKRRGPYGAHEEYASHLRSKTDWFDVPVKLVRDKFVVHASPTHMLFLGWPEGKWELELNVVLPRGADPKRPLERVHNVTFNVVRLSRDIEELLCWFAGYALRATDRKS